MKLTLVVLACLAVVGINAASVHNNVYPVDKAFVTKQKFLFEIVYNIDEPLHFPEYIKYAEKLIFEKSAYTKFDFYMIKFFEDLKVGGLLPKGEFFGAVQKEHVYQARGLFNFFYYAKDFETFMHNVCWARVHVNEGMFVYALTLAVIHRPDLKGLILPSIYEIFPQMFFKSEFVLQAEKFDPDVWYKQIALEKEYKTIFHEQSTSEIFGDHFYLKDWKMWQWWKLMGLEKDWHLEEKNIFRDNTDVFKNDAKYKAVWEGVKAYWYPVDYTRDVEIYNKESKLSYFTEDVAWNAYWYYLNMDYAKILEGKEFHLDKDRRGEFWIYNVQQLFNRYYFERLSNGFGDLKDFSFFQDVIKTGYNPQLMTYNGEGFTYRKNYYELQSYHNADMFNKFVTVDRRIKDVIDSGKYVTKDGVVVDLTKPEAIEFVGDLMQGNVDIIDRHFFGFWFTFANIFISGGKLNDFIVAPNVFLNYETQLRDPLTYYIFKKVFTVFKHYKSYLPPYTHDEVVLPTVKIEDVQVSKLKTYFDLVDIDVTNLLNAEMTFVDGKYVWDKTLLARQLRLNHKPFNFDIQVKSDVAQKVVVRTFLAPDFDEYGQKIELFDNVFHFMELDEFVYDLVAGVNVIKRSSEDFYYTIGDQTTYTELYKFVMLAYEGKQEFPMEVTQPHCGFPDRLILPHGWVKGMPMKMIFVISPYAEKYEQFSTFDYNYTCGIGSGVRYIDSLPFGYPFDRKIEHLYEFIGPNMYVKDVKIFHTDKYEKYYPKKYEHFGTFDYTF